MYSFRVDRKDGTALVRVIADGDHVVEALTVEFPNVLGAVAGKVDPKLRHHRDRLRAHDARLRPCGTHFEPVSTKRS